jgi:hypothetical protein
MVIPQLKIILRKMHDENEGENEGVKMKVPRSPVAMLGTTVMFDA